MNITKKPTTTSAPATGLVNRSASSSPTAAKAATTLATIHNTAPSRPRAKSGGRIRHHPLDRPDRLRHG
jgi:hypothetical protein